MKKLIFFCLIHFSGMYATYGQNKIEKRLEKYIEKLHHSFNTIPLSRKKVLKELGTAIVDKRIKHEVCNLLVVGKSNAARSQIMEAFIKATAAYYNIDSVYSYSGGYEVTKINENVISALEEAGFIISKIDKDKNQDNPKYLLGIGKKFNDQTIFSKRYDHPFNPPEDFFSILIEEKGIKNKNIPAKHKKFHIFYEEMKLHNGKDKSSSHYHERMRQIALDMAYLMDYVKKELMLQRD